MPPRSGELSLTFLEEDACSAVLHDTLLHCETLLVVSTGDLQNVTFVVLSHNITFDFLSHSLLEERTTADKNVTS